MNLLQAIILGIVQGLTEFLPVSSSGHLTLVSALMDLPSDILFTVVVHVATLLAVVIAFRSDIVKLVRGLLGLCFDGFKTRGLSNRRLVVMGLEALRQPQRAELRLGDGALHGDLGQLRDRADSGGYLGAVVRLRADGDSAADSDWRTGIHVLRLCGALRAPPPGGDAPASGNRTGNYGKS